jgi:hypothetical protein
MVTFEATAEQRRTVRAMAGFGVPQEDIATFLDIDPKTLRKHFRAELDRGSIEATTKVAQSLFRMATEGNNVAAAIFWMKARAGWSERQRIEHGFGGPLAVISGVPRADDLSDDQLARIAGQGLEDAGPDVRQHGQAQRRASYVIDSPTDDISPDQWQAQHAPQR